MTSNREQNELWCLLVSNETLQHSLHGFRRRCLFQLYRLKDGYHLPILALTNGSTHIFMSCWLAGSAIKKMEKTKRDGRSGVHIKAYFWSIGVHPPTVHSLSCFLQNKAMLSLMVLGFFKN